MLRMLTGTHAATAILGALFERERTGTGRHLDLALFDVALASMVNQGQAALSTGVAPERLGTAHPSIVPYQAMQAADGWLTVAVGNDRQFERFAAALGLAELAADERFTRNSARVANRNTLIPLLQNVLAKRTRDEWLAVLSESGVPVSPVNSLPEALADPQVVARGMVAPVRHEGVADFSMIQSPFAPTTGNAPARRAPPRLGEHTREVLGEELGLTPAVLDELVASGAVSVMS